MKYAFIVMLVILPLALVQSEDVCKLVLNCIQDAQKAQAQCDSLKPAGNGTNPKKQNKDGKCNVSEKQQQIKQKTGEQKKMYIDCLTKRLSESYDMIQAMKAKKSERCESAITNYQSPTSAGNSTNSRKVRAADDEEDQDADGAGNNKGGKGQGKGKGKGKGKGHGGGPAQQCQRAAKQKFHQCKAMADCCSEATICHLQFELSSLHDDIRKLQLDVATKRHDCQKAKLSTEQQTPSLMRDDPLSKGKANMQSGSNEDEADTKFDVKNDMDKFDSTYSSDEDV